jgi:hypothetical protein
MSTAELFQTTHCHMPEHCSLHSHNQRCLSICCRNCFTRHEGEGLYHPHHMQKTIPWIQKCGGKYVMATLRITEFKNWLYISEECYLLGYNTVVCWKSTDVSEELRLHLPGWSSTCHLLSCWFLALLIELFITTDEGNLKSCMVVSVFKTTLNHHILFTTLEVAK